MLPFALLALVVGRPAGGPAEPVHSLPKDTQPERLVLASDGALWMTNEIAGTTRLSRGGRAQRFLARDDASLADITAGPDGSVWAVEDGEALQLDPAGRVTR